MFSGFFFFFSSRRRHTRCGRDWSSDVCSSDLPRPPHLALRAGDREAALLGAVVGERVTVSERRRQEEATLERGAAERAGALPPERANSQNDLEQATLSYRI